MQNQASNVVTQDKVAHALKFSKPLQLISALMLGAVIMYGVGFLNTSAAHNAAHDTRHSQGFPCH